MSTPRRPFANDRPNLGPGGEATHAALMAAMPPDAPAVLDRHETTLADHEGRLQHLEAAHPDAPREDVA